MILESLMDATGLGSRDIYKIISTAPVRYKVFTIPKRSGGLREIAQPSRALKAIQRTLLSSLLLKLPVHDCAMAYRTGVGLRMNADAHSKSSFLLKLDFNDFFNSIRVEDWDTYVRRSGLGLSIEERYLVRRALFYGGGINEPRYLSVGAPTSPHVSNLLLFSFDQNVERFAQDQSVTYTRYADDITLSGDRSEALLRVERRIASYILTVRSPRLTLNEAKRGFYSRAGKRMVTGLVITPTGRISIGRQRKRLISSMIYRIVHESDCSEEHLLRTKGYLGFAIGCEPEFVTRLRAKYGDATIDRILQYEPPSA